MFHALTADPHIAFLLRRASGSRGRMAVVRAVRANAIERLNAAVQRVPRIPERLLPAYRAKGISPAWNLQNNDAAVEFALALGRYAPTDDERAAAALLRACVAAEEAGDVMPLADEALAAATRSTQRARRAGKPAGDPADTTRDMRLRKHHARLVQAGRRDATAATATEFGLSTRRVREILRA